GLERWCSMRHREGNSAQTLQRYPHIDRCRRGTAVAEDLAYDFDVGACIDLPTRVTVPESMGPHHSGGNTCQPRVVLDAVTNGAAGHRLVRHIFPDEDMLSGLRRRPFPSQVCGQCLRDCG